MKHRLLIAMLMVQFPLHINTAGAGAIIPDSVVSNYVETFNARDTELYPQSITNSAAAAFLLENCPRFLCPDPDVERTYYFRWWTFRKHIRKTAAGGHVITEFLAPVPHAGPENIISCPVGHQFREGRWLRDPRYLDDYARFWLAGVAEEKFLRRYSVWLADSLLQQARATGSDALVRELLPKLVHNFREWEKIRRDPNGLFWQRDLFDGMEESSAFAEFGGKDHDSDNHYRATINSYMAADALAIASLAKRAGDAATAAEFEKTAAEILALRDEKLWDENTRFYKVAFRGKTPPSSSSALRLNTDRELHGYTPWYFDNAMPEPARDDAWLQLADWDGFRAPFGPTTCEQRGKYFLLAYSGRRFCQWNGPSWPFATAQTLTALANVINDPRRSAGFSARDSADRNVRAPVSAAAADFAELKTIWLDTFLTYARSHKLRLDDGTLVPWIDENLNPLNGDWLSRARFKVYNKGQWRQPEQHSKDYNHSTFCDLVITMLAGLRPAEGDMLTVNPIIPEDWDWFCLENVRYHGRDLTIIYDKTGEKFHRGAGLRVYINGAQAGAAARIGTPLQVDL
ncbi:hypothetical protein OH491_14765 [Termitidicoccus mucosus]|uniref:Alpha-L-rhamnosidase six-hairpin glycosidase domain-containing protein n=1 Tax=Termitidicoccus mucosus TaxID=1184151 RepID=A0A178IBB9_9BACT|nr:hypothetical protein AW736_25475 [Opitutaceae bacterium TSB47]